MGRAYVALYVVDPEPVPFVVRRDEAARRADGLEGEAPHQVRAYVLVLPRFADECPSSMLIWLLCGSAVFVIAIMGNLIVRIVA